MENKFNLIEVEVNKISLKPGDVLLAKVRGPDFKDDSVCEALKESLRQVFPNNKVGVLFLEENQIDFNVISQETAQLLEKASKGEETSCNPQTACVECECGKKERLEALATPPEVLTELPKEEETK